MKTSKPPSTRRRQEPGNEWPGDAKRLVAALKKRVAGEVRFDAGARALYSTDSSNYRQIPIGVVVPQTVEDVIETVAVCREFDAPILSRGGGTSLAGQCCNVAVVIDYSKYLHRIRELDAAGKFAIVDPGIVLDDLRAAAERYHLTFGPDPSTHAYCTLGGMIGNNSCGVHSVMAGKTVDNIEELDVLTYDGLRLRLGRTSDDELAQAIREGGRRGEIYRGLKDLRDRYAGLIRKKYPKLPRRVSGYNLDQLLPENGFDVARALVGSEGTCVTVLQAKVRLVHSPPFRVVLALGYPDVYEAGDHVPDVLEHGPLGLEGIDDVLPRNMKKLHMHAKDLELLPEGNGWLIAEFGGDSREEAEEKARNVMRRLKKFWGRSPSMKLYTDPYEEEKIWEIRESGLGATARVPGDPVTWEGWEDSAVPPHQVGIYLRALRKLFNKFGYACSLYGHFGDGCIHTRIDFGLKDKSGIEKYQRFVREAAAIVAGFGGSISGEHGDGQSKADLLPIMFGPELVQAFHEFKKIWDPRNRMNPGKIVHAFHNDENLRLGAGYNPWQPPTKFFYAEDGGNFAESMLRCVGVGKCRHGESGTMCPSYMVTREEKHTTRGRARLLFEMLQGEVIRDGWRSREVRDGLDLCLSCKGCQSDCPMHVDMATYKAEFLSHYYEGRLRPRTAYAMGLIRWWARLASRMPRFVNFLGNAPMTGRLMKWLAGISQQRKLPQFAKQTFREWWAERGRPAREFPAGPADGPSALREKKSPVILWVDTFNNHFHPEILQAAVEVLETTGHRVILPEQKLCCGRPLYDYGMLDLAKKMLGDILISMRRHIRDEIPVVGLEPSCVAVFRDELKRLFPFDEDARRLSQKVMTLGEFFVKHSRYDFPKLMEKAVVHGHCHQKAVMKMDAETELLRRIGLEFELLDSGCCGMAGSFGFEADHYEVSVKCGERMLLPAVRDVKGKKLVIADGFSCREQIEQLDGHRALHTVEVVLRALRLGSHIHPEGKLIHPSQTVPEMQEQSALKNRRRSEPMKTE